MKVALAGRAKLGIFLNPASAFGTFMATVHVIAGDPKRNTDDCADDGQAKQDANNLHDNAGGGRLAGWNWPALAHNGRQRRRHDGRGRNIAGDGQRHSEAARRAGRGLANEVRIKFNVLAAMLAGRLYGGGCHGALVVMTATTCGLPQSHNSNVSGLPRYKTFVTPARIQGVSIQSPFATPLPVLSS